MKNFIKGMILGALIIGGIFGIKSYIDNQNQKVKLIDEIITLDNGSQLQNLNDGSYIIINKDENKYIFQPTDLGDWNYEFNNINDLNKIVKTYLEIKNNGSF